MKKFKVHIKKDSFYINASGSVIGVFCFSFGDWYFPSKKWDDFVVILLAWLTKQTVELSFKKNKTVEMCFMEGCFKISIA